MTMAIWAILNLILEYPTSGHNILDIHLVWPKGSKYISVCVLFAFSPLRKLVTLHRKVVPSTYFVSPPWLSAPAIKLQAAQRDK